MIDFIPSAIIFDFDGVLLNSIRIHTNAWINAFQNIFQKEFPHLQTEALSGRSSYEIAQTIAIAGGSPKLAEILLKEKNRLLSLIVTPQLEPGTRELVDLLHNANIPFGICSNAHSLFIEQITIQNGFNFPVIIGFDNTPTPKPAPDGYLLAAELLGISDGNIERVIVLEDSYPGLQAAQAAQMFPVGIEYQHSAEELLTYGAKVTAKNIKEVYDTNLLKI